MKRLIAIAGLFLALGFLQGNAFGRGGHGGGHRGYSSHRGGGHRGGGYHREYGHRGYGGHGR